MRTRRLTVGHCLTRALLVGVMLAGCATVPPQPASGSSAAEPYAPTRPPASPAATVLNVLVTPIYFALKVAVCGATVAIAAPLTGLAAITDPHGDGWQRQDLSKGFASNCGPPYTLF